MPSKDKLRLVATQKQPALPPMIDFRGQVLRGRVMVLRPFLAAPRNKKLFIAAIRDAVLLRLLKAVRFRARHAAKS